MQFSYTSLLMMLRSSPAAWVVACTDLCISWRHVVLSRSSWSIEAGVASPGTRFRLQVRAGGEQKHNSGHNAFTALILSGVTRLPQV